MHVSSERYRVAALANIATDPDYRRQGYGKAVIAGLCKQLQGRVDHIGLNINSINIPALRCYESLGFEVIGSYEQLIAELK